MMDDDGEDYIWRCYLMFLFSQAVRATGGRLYEIQNREHVSIRPPGGRWHANAIKSGTQILKSQTWLHPALPLHPTGRINTVFVRIFRLLRQWRCPTPLPWPHSGPCETDNSHYSKSSMAKNMKNAKKRIFHIYIKQANAWKWGLSY